MKDLFSKFHIKKSEIIALTILFVFTFIFFIITQLLKSNNNSKKNIAIYIDNNIINSVNNKKIDINEDMTFIIFENEDGTINLEEFNSQNPIQQDKLKRSDNQNIKTNYNIIEIKNKKVRCIEANCPDKICVKHGALNALIDNDMIICVPHKLTIVYK